LLLIQGRAHTTAPVCPKEPLTHLAERFGRLTCGTQRQQELIQVALPGLLLR
jgi:hypothetical protein